MREPRVRSQTTSEKRGIALIGVVGFLLVFLVFAGALVTQLANETNSTKMAAVSNRALSAADAGVQAMVEQIQSSLAQNLAVPAQVQYSYPEPGASPSVVSYLATVVNPPITANGLNYYVITSTGTFSATFGVGESMLLTRTVRAIAVAQPISGYASLSNYETNKWGNPVWYVSTQHFDGPVYSGGPMRIDYATPAPSPGPTVEPIFLSTVETVNQPVWAPNAPGQNAGDWSDIISGGSQQFTVNNTPVSLPQPAQNVYVASEAWQGNGNNTTSLPSGVSPGVYIDGSTSGGEDAAHTTQPTDTTGIYIETGTTTQYNGSATIVSTVSNNTETMYITSPAWSGAYQVVINYTGFEQNGNCSGTTTVTFGNAHHTFSGAPCGAPGPGVTNTGNGAIYADGNVQLGCTASAASCGTTPNANTDLVGSYAMATPDFGSWGGKANNITILGNLTYDAGSQLYDELGLWANDVILSTKSTAGITIDASIIAGYPGEPDTDGDFYSANCNQNSCGNLDQGTLTIFGGLIENIRGAVGELYAGNGPCGFPQCGFSRTIDFDSRLATSPPPFNPTTGNLKIIAWEDLGS
jgi:hypothetical protein